MPTKIRRFEKTYDPSNGGYRRRLRSTPDFGSVEVEVGRLWYAMVMLLRPVHVLETGTYWGYSTSMIAAGLRDLGQGGVVTSIDPVEADHLWEGTALSRHVKWICARSQDVAADLKGTTFDMLVLDSDHHYRTIMEELIAFEPLLKPGGVILLHDTLFFDGVGAAVRQLRENPRFEVVTLDSPRTHGKPGWRPPGVTICRKLKRRGPALRFDEALADLHVGDPKTPAFVRRGKKSAMKDAPRPHPGGSTKEHPKG